MGVIVSYGGHVTYDPLGSPPEGYVEGSDGVWRMPGAGPSAEDILSQVRKNLKTPEGESIILWSAKVSGLITVTKAGEPNRASDSWGIFPVGIMP